MEEPLGNLDRGMDVVSSVGYDGATRAERAARRYLALLKGALLDEHYLENEVRLQYVLDCLANGRSPETRVLHDPPRQLRNEFNRLVAARRAGTSNGADGTILPYTEMGRVRLEHLERCLDRIREESVDGDLVECGTLRGGGAIFQRGYLEAYELDDRQVWVADEFSGSAELNLVREGFDRFGLLDARVRFLQGEVSTALADALIEHVALARIETQTYEATRAALEELYGHLAVGGYVIVGDYGLTDARRAVDEFRSQLGVDDPIERVDWASAAWRKLQPDHAARPRVARASPGRHAPLAPALTGGELDLSVVIVFYNMRREAERTLHSLSRAYQREIDELGYEVIVVENGSAEDQRLGAEYVRSFGPEFTYIDLSEEATPSPVRALNHGIKASLGNAIALMIDGAHVLTPRVLRFGTMAMDVYDPALVATQQWYVGPGQQPDTLRQGYDQDYEDRLFAQIDWPADGYRLFDIGHFIGERDWFDGLWESNCIFVPRRLLEQFGSMDESFSMPGGGFANLDLYERIGAAPDVTVASILGEGSFHQAHGGTTTNAPDSDERSVLLASYHEHYSELRGRPFRGPGKPIHFVGSMFDGARRTRARRHTAIELFKRGQRIAADRHPEQPAPIPEDLKLEFTDAFWRSFAWRQTKWLGRSVPKNPTDLVVYQELIATVRPDWIVETNTGGGGRTFFLASVCDLVGHGRVVSIDVEAAPKLPEHPRITYLAGDMVDDAVVEQVRELVGEPARALVLFGLANRQRLMTAFEAYSPLVPVGSYIVLEDTITNGHPVWTGMGPGPAEAIKGILAMHREFASDPTMEKLALTFNPGGFLKRIR